MATPKQIAANRRNALRSTGPRTLAGRAASSMNALKTGIDAKSTLIRGEDPQLLTALIAEYYDCWLPTTPEERFLVDTLISCEWYRRRCIAAETSMWNREFETSVNPDLPIGYAYARREDEFARLQRRLDAIQRNYFRALRELERLGTFPEVVITEAEPTDDTPLPVQVEPAKDKSPQLASFLPASIPLPIAPPIPLDPVIIE